MEVPRALFFIWACLFLCGLRMFIQCVELYVLQKYICLFVCVDFWWCVCVSLFCVCALACVRSIEFSYRILKNNSGKTQNVEIFLLRISQGVFQWTWCILSTISVGSFSIHRRTKSSFIWKTVDSNFVLSYRDYGDVAKLSDELFVFSKYIPVSWEGSYSKRTNRLSYFLLSQCCECLGYWHFCVYYFFQIFLFQ